MDWNDVEKQFRELEAQRYTKIAGELSAYMQALMSKGFTRREASRLVENFAEILHETMLDELARQLEELADDDDQGDPPPTAR